MENGGHRTVNAVTPISMADWLHSRFGAAVLRGIDDQQVMFGHFGNLLENTRFGTWSINMYPDFGYGLQSYLYRS